MDRLRELRARQEAEARLAQAQAEAEEVLRQFEAGNIHPQLQEPQDGAAAPHQPEQEAVEIDGRGDDEEFVLAMDLDLEDAALDAIMDNNNDNNINNIDENNENDNINDEDENDENPAAAA